jgi:hypothetical protein
MPKRASVPEGKALFYHSPEQPAPATSTAEPSPTSEDAAPDPAVGSGRTSSRDETSAPTEQPAPVQLQPRQIDSGSARQPDSQAAVAPHKSTRQSAIFLEEYHLDWLDDRCREARRNGGRAVRKAAVIRALLDIAMEANIDLTTLQSEDEIKPRIRAAFRPL